MEDMAELIAQYLQQHESAYTLEASSSAAGTGTQEHQPGQHYPCEVGPQAYIVVEHTRGSDKRYYLEQGCTQAVFPVIVQPEVEQQAYEGGGRQDCGQIEPELWILEYRPPAELDHRHI